MSSARPAQSGLSANLGTPPTLAGLDAEVAAVLAEFLAVAGLQRVTPIPAYGGLSGAQLWRVEIEGAAFALREWPAEHPSPERLRFIHAVLAHAHHYGLSLVPVPVPARSGETFVAQKGRLWELAPWLPGEASFQRQPTQAKIDSALRTLAHFHLATADFPLERILKFENEPILGATGSASAVYADANTLAEPVAPEFQNTFLNSRIGETRRRGPSTGLIERAGRLAELDYEHLASYQHAVNAHSIDKSHDALAHEMLIALPRAVESARPMLDPATHIHLRLQPCLRDIWHGNLLFTGDEVTGIVDFGAVQIDSPALDIARLLGSMADDDGNAWRHGIAAYEQWRPLSSDETAAIIAADASGTVLGCVNWLQWLYVERRQFCDLQAVEIRMNSLVERLRRLASGGTTGAIAFAAPRSLR